MKHKTTGEQMLDVMNTELFLSLINEGRPKYCPHVEQYKLNKAEVLEYFEFFKSLPWMTENGKYELGIAMLQLIERAKR